MRTSRIAQQTARVVDALSPSKAVTAVRRSLRGFAHNSTSEATAHPVDLSAKSPDIDEDGTRSNGAMKKRKRDDSVDSAQPVRASPRKAPKQEHGAEEKKKTRRMPAKKVKNEDGEVVVNPPTNWEEMYNITAEMRKRVLAPVDTMGCETLAQEHASPVDKRLQTLVALMLSSQTKDTVTAVAMKNLQEGLPGGFNLDALLNVEPEQLNSLICKVGFHNNKTKFIKAVAPILRDQYNGDIPDTIDGLIGLPGVGPKMAYLCMSAAWGRDEGIGVDVHVHRITNLWKWHKTSTPEQTRAELEAWLPKEKWHDINHLLVGLGQTICLPVGRRCDECDLKIKKLCPSVVASSPRKKPRVKQEIEIETTRETPVKMEQTVVEADDNAVSVHIKSEDLGDVETSAPVRDIEDLAGSRV